MSETVHIWPDDSFCSPNELEEYLTFHSDDYVTVQIGDQAEVPSYDEVTGQ